MELNPDKGNILSIGNSKINYSLQSKIIRKVTSMKDIGVTVQCNLNFNTMRNRFTTFKYHDDIVFICNCIPPMFHLYWNMILMYGHQF